MPPRRILSEPTTPDPPRTQGPLGDILNLVQQLTPSKSDRQGRALHEQLGVVVSEAEDEYAAKESEIADLSNQLVPAKSQRRRKRFNRADDADESVEAPGAPEERVRKAGRHMQVNEAVWLEAEAAFDFATEFDSKANRIQAQIHDVVRLLPKVAVPLRTQEWIASAFADGTGGQRSATVTRLRHPSLIHLCDKDEYKHFSSSSSRFQHFKERIGYIAATETEGAYYSTFLAPILYDEFHGDIDVQHLFRNPFLLQIHASILRGPDGGQDLFTDHPHPVQGGHVQKLHRIKRTTTGAIANSAVWAIWLYSADTKFLDRGPETHINYVKRYFDYAEQLRKALARKKAWAIDLLQYWDDVLFPDADDDIDARGGEGQIAERESAMEAFDNVPSRQSTPASLDVGNENQGDDDDNDVNNGQAESTPTIPRVRQREPTPTAPTPEPPRNRRRTEEPAGSPPPAASTSRAGDSGRSSQVPPRGSKRRATLRR
ncbi:hypothetical protein R3P38DRAFT_3223671 [Favolaschia claudopus]|uniref:Uncharacterized protein n=1 Tax=Favolaschia claudopus TaxID=2862362 RepID=A0AAV9ZXR4_9AGAR